MDTQSVEFKNDARNFDSHDRHPNIPKVKARSLSDGLRVLGVISLISSGFFYLLQGLVVMSSFERFLSFTLVAVGLGILGLLVGGQMREPKSARSFLGLAAAATPVLFAQLGAMFYANQNQIANVPSVFMISAPSLSITFLALASVTLLMSPILYIGFGAFYRERAKELVLFLMACSALLLLPTRASNLEAMLIFAQLALLYSFEQIQMKMPKIAGEAERSLAKLILLIPVGIMIGRGLFYHPGNLFFSSAAAAISLTCFCYAPTGRLFFLGTIAAACAWFFAAYDFLSLNAYFDSTRFLIAAYSASIGVLLFAKPETGNAKRKLLRFFGQMFAFYIPVFCFFSSWSYDVAIASLGLGLVATAAGFSRHDLSVFRSGLFVSILGLIYCLTNIWELAWKTPWVSLAGIGVLGILIAGYIEKNRGQLTRFKNTYQEHFAFRPVEKIN